VTDFLTEQGRNEVRAIADRVRHQLTGIGWWGRTVDALLAERDLLARKVGVLAAKLSEAAGSGPCDAADWWPCPLLGEQENLDTCLNDEGGVCWVKWSATQAERPAEEESGDDGKAR